MSRVVLAMSGGVDSSVAAWLLREQGHEVIGLFMRHGSGAGPADCRARPGPAGRSRAAARAADAADARRVADVLGIPFYAVNFEEEFGRIVDYFVDEYTAGRTPNPCIVCNTWLKFGKLFEYADSVGAEFVATGHYARLVRPTDGRARPCAAAATRPRTSRTCCSASDARVLPRLMFPVGEHRKDEIRRIAARLGLRVADKPRQPGDLLRARPGPRPASSAGAAAASTPSGEIVTTDGRVVGRHDGFEQFTVGQRKGLGMAFGEPRYVVRIEPDTRRVVIGTRDELARRELTAAEANWLVDPPTRAAPLPGEDPLPQPGRCRPRSSRWRTAGSASASTSPVHGVAPGQAAVCYDGDRVLGGGWIE